MNKLAKFSLMAALAAAPVMADEDFGGIGDDGAVFCVVSAVDGISYVVHEPGDLCQFHHVDMGFVPAFSGLQGDRDRHCLRHSPDDPPCQLRIFHQRGALAVVHDLRHRAAHVDVEEVEVNLRPLADDVQRLRNKLRLTPEKLHRHRPLFFLRLHQLRRLAVAVADRLRADHLHRDEARALFAAKQTKRQVRDPCHWRHQNVILKCHAADLEGVQICFTHLFPCWGGIRGCRPISHSLQW